jgi:hypothetical protein
VGRVASPILFSGEGGDGTPEDMNLCTPLIRKGEKAKQESMGRRVVVEVYERKEIRKIAMGVGGLHAKISWHASSLPVIRSAFSPTPLTYSRAFFLKKSSTPSLCLILVSVFSFRHLGHLQTDNMSLQFVLVPWSLSVDK